MNNKDNQIPICPNCKKGTKRRYLYSTSTLEYNPIIYDENGNVETNGNLNNTEDIYKCLECGTIYSDKNCYRICKEELL